MNPQLEGRAVALRPQLWVALALAVALAWPAAAHAQRKRREPRRQADAPAKRADRDANAEAAQDTPAQGKSAGKEKGKVQVFDFSGLTLQGSMRTPQLLYFLGRASEELRRASLERRSFVPEMVRSLEEAPL